MAWGFIRYMPKGQRPPRRIRRNSANYTAITPFKVIQGHRKPICDFLLVINTSFLHRFQVMADYWSNFR